MRKVIASIEFESRNEVLDIMEMIDNYWKQNPEEKNNETIKGFWDTLNTIDDIEYIY